MDSKDKSEQNKVITVDFSNRETGNVEIYTEQPKIINHPIIRERRKRLCLKLKINNQWF
jgi:glyoxylate carboligase